MDGMGLMDFPRRVYDVMPGGFSGAVNLSLRDGEGPVATKTRDEWLSIFLEYDLFCAGVNTLMDLQKDPQILANDYLIDFEHPTMGKIKIPGYPIHFSGSYAGTTSAAPELGEHTDEVLIELGGYDHKEIEAFRQEGIV